MENRWDVLPIAFQYQIYQVITSKFLTKLWLTYGQENNHEEYFMYSGYLRIEPCLLAHGYIRSSCCARCHLQAETQKHCLWKHFLRIFANYFPPSVFTRGMVVWKSCVCSIFITTLNLWTMVFMLTLEVFMYFHQCLCNFQG